MKGAASFNPSKRLDDQAADHFERARERQRAACGHRLRSARSKAAKARGFGHRGARNKNKNKVRQFEEQPEAARARARAETFSFLNSKAVSVACNHAAAWGGWVVGARPGDDFCEFDSWPGDYCGCMDCAEANIDMLSRYDDYMEEKMWRSRGSNSEHRFDQRFDQRADPQPSDSNESSNWSGYSRTRQGGECTRLEVNENQRRVKGGLGQGGISPSNF